MAGPGIIRNREGGAMDDGAGGQRRARTGPGSGGGLRGRPALGPSARIRGGRARSAILVLALVGAALLAACGGSGNPVSAALTNYQKALAYSQCPGFTSNSHVFCGVP